MASSVITPSPLDPDPTEISATARLEESTEARPRHPLADLVDESRTQQGALRASRSADYLPPDHSAPNGYYKGRPIIGRNSSIAGGVYLGGGAREAIVMQEDELLLGVYSTFIKPRIVSGKYPLERILDIVYEEVRVLTPYSSRIVDQITMFKDHDDEVYISSFIKNWGGICRHQALLVAYFLEKLIEDGLVNGKISCRRNRIGFLGAHAWARFESPKLREAYLIDPAQGYCGPASEVPQGAWMYEAPIGPDLLAMHQQDYAELGEIKPSVVPYSPLRHERIGEILEGIVDLQGGARKAIRSLLKRLRPLVTKKIGHEAGSPEEEQQLISRLVGHLEEAGNWQEAVARANDINNLEDFGGRHVVSALRDFGHKLPATTAKPGEVILYAPILGEFAIQDDVSMERRTLLSTESRNHESRIIHVSTNLKAKEKNVPITALIGVRREIIKGKPPGTWQQIWG